VSQEELESIKKENQEHLLNTKYLRSHILLVSKEDLGSIKEIDKSTFKTSKRDLTKIGKGTFRRAKKDLSMHLLQPLQTKVPIGNLYK